MTQEEIKAFFQGLAVANVGGITVSNITSYPIANTVVGYNLETSNITGAVLYSDGKNVVVQEYTFGSATVDEKEVVWIKEVIASIQDKKYKITVEYPSGIDETTGLYSNAKIGNISINNLHAMPDNSRLGVVWAYIMEAFKYGYGTLIEEKHSTGIILKDGYITDDDTSEYDYWNWPSSTGKFNDMVYGLSYDFTTGIVARWNTHPSKGGAKKVLDLGYSIESYFYSGGVRNYEGYNPGDGIWWSNGYAWGSKANNMDITIFHLGTCEDVINSIPDDKWKKGESDDYSYLHLFGNHIKKYSGTDYFYIALAYDDRTSDDDWSSAEHDISEYGWSSSSTNTYNATFTVYKSKLLSHKDLWLKIGATTRYGIFDLMDAYFDKS